MNNDELIQQYLDHKLNGADLQKFNLLYSQDSQFKSQVDQYQEIIKGIKYSGISKIRNEVKNIHPIVMTEMQKDSEFESDLSKALRLKQRMDIKSEIDQVKTEIMNKSQSNDESSTSSKVVSLNPYRFLAMAASLLLLISLSIFLLKRNGTIDQERLSRVYLVIKLNAQSAGIADPNQAIHVHQQRVFEYLEHNQMDSAQQIQDTYYSKQIKNADYYMMNGLIYFKAGRNAQAKKSFADGVKYGDQCLSKLLLALMNDKGIVATDLIVKEIKENAVCQSSELVNSILKELKW